MTPWDLQKQARFASSSSTSKWDKCNDAVEVILLGPGLVIAFGRKYVA